VPGSFHGSVEVAYNEVFRRDVGGEWSKIGTLIEINGIFTDYSAKCGVLHEYKVRAVAVNTAYIDSQIQQASVIFKDAQIILVSNLSKWVKLKWLPQRQRTKSYEVTTMKFAGRPMSVAQYGEHVDGNMSMSFKILDVEQLNLFEEIADMQETVLYRDSRGRSILGIISDFSVQDERPKYWTLSFNLIEVDVGGI
jgi:hypothetical protein